MPCRGLIRDELKPVGKWDGHRGQGGSPLAVDFAACGWLCWAAGLVGWLGFGLCGPPPWCCGAMGWPGCAVLRGWLAGSALGCVGPPMVLRRHGLASAPLPPWVSGSCAMGPLGGLMAGFVFGLGALGPGGRT